TTTITPVPSHTLFRSPPKDGHPRPHLRDGDTRRRPRTARLHPARPATERIPARVGPACRAGPGADGRGPSRRRPGRAAGGVHGAHDRAASGHSGGDGFRHEPDRRRVPRLRAGPAQAGQRNRRRHRGLPAGVGAKARRRRTGWRPMSRRLPPLVLALAAAGACASSNAMWNARQLANEARALEAEGRAGDAAAAWARVAVKAESVAVRHPGSPQMDDALVLQREALARIGSCGVAVAPLRRVVQGGSDGSLRERAALVLAECALDAGDPAAAGRALAGPLASRDRGRRSRAAYLAARAAVLRGDVPAALLDTLTRRRFVEGEWATLLDEVARAIGPDVAAKTLDRLTRQRAPDGARARLLLADGNRRLAGGDLDAAQRRHAEVD